MHPNNTVYFLASGMAVVAEPAINIDPMNGDDNMLTKTEFATAVKEAQEHLALLSDPHPALSAECQDMISSIRDSLTTIADIVASKNDRWAEEWNDALINICWNVRDVKHTVTSLTRNNFRDPEARFKPMVTFLARDVRHLNLYRNIGGKED